jgi:hypothetical protein
VRRVASVIVVAILVVVGLFCIGRALAELFTVTWGEPVGYRHDWGGPHLLGVLAVHCGPGVVAAACFYRFGRARWSRSGRSQAPVRLLAGRVNKRYLPRESGATRRRG